MTKPPTRPPFLSLVPLPEDKNKFADFVQRITDITDQMVRTEKVTVAVAADGLQRLRADLMARGADARTVQPIDGLLEKYRN